MKIKDQIIPEMNTSEKIFKLTDQIKSKSCHLYINGKLEPEDSKETKMIEFQFVFWQYLTPKVNIQILMKHE